MKLPPFRRWLGWVWEVQLPFEDVVAALGPRDSFFEFFQSPMISRSHIGPKMFPVNGRLSCSQVQFKNRSSSIE